jgi:hypothetical protein
MMKSREEYERERTEHQRQYDVVQAEFPGLVTRRFECHEGWFPLLREFFTVVRRVIPSGHEDAFTLFQVKEKFAGLRIYYQLGGDLPDAAKATIRDAYRAAEASAERTCDVCGAPGVMRARGGWYATRCEDHADGAVPVPSEGTP